MLTKESLKKEFQKDWKNHYEVEVFRERGFIRKVCKRCGKAFWTTDHDRELCGTPSCENYGFIGKPITRKKMDYVEMWRIFEKFFVKNGHTSIPRYPVVDRWRPDLYFTIASIQDFQRIDGGNIVMEYPADPLIVPQVCLRFNDIPNVGVTGRHHTSFIMPGQHSFGKYWKDECIRLNFEFLHNTLGVPENEIIYVEDLWAMPDFSQFGPSLETFSRALELVNSVFSQFTATSSGYKELPQKVIDVGWGHERLVWFSQGTATGYDAVFGPVVRWAKKEAGLEGNELFKKYAIMAGSMNFDEADTYIIIREIARKLGVGVDEINHAVRPMQALYAILDHTKTLLFAITDGAIPSNVGGGYNLRVLFRRMFSFMDEYNLEFDMVRMTEMHAKFLRPMFPELMEGIGTFSEIYDIERKKYDMTMKRARSIVERMIKNENKIDSDTMIKLYTSNGITPEIVRKVAEEKKINVEIPDDFYVKLTEQHMSRKKEKKNRKIEIDVKGMDDTKRLFYDEPYMKEFDANVVKYENGWLVLDQTLFYPEGGGQPHDVGTINGHSVRDVQKIGNVIIHRVEGDFKTGMKVHGVIDWDRRYRLMKMHTATHIVAGATRKLFGRHVWQSGAQKGYKSSRIDLTHYRPFTIEDIEKIEKLANSVVEKRLDVGISIMNRNEAEQMYGFILYQGGASPGKMVRVIRIPAKGEIFDVEACGGTHLTNTGEIGKIRIIRTERVQDGVNRIEFTVAEEAERQEKIEKEMFERIINDKLKGIGINVKITENPRRQLLKSADILSVGLEQLEQTFDKFTGMIKRDIKKLNNMGLKIEIERDVRDLPEATKHVFETWKKLEKEIEKYSKGNVDKYAETLMKKSTGDYIEEFVDMDRKEMIKLAEHILEMNKNMSIVLINKDGDVVAMSEREDAGDVIKKVLSKYGGKGGGKGRLAQGKVENYKRNN